MKEQEHQGNRSVVKNADHAKSYDQQTYLWFFHDVSFKEILRVSPYQVLKQAAWITAYIGWPWLLALLSVDVTNTLCLILLFLGLPIQLFIAFLGNKLRKASGVPSTRENSHAETFSALGAVIFLVSVDGASFYDLYDREAMGGFAQSALFVLHHILNSLSLGIIDNLGLSLTTLEPLGWRGRAVQTFISVMVIYEVAKFVSSALVDRTRAELFLGTTAEASARAADRGGYKGAYVSKIKETSEIEIENYSVFDIAKKVSSAEGLEEVLKRLRDPLYGTYLLSLLFTKGGKGKYGILYWSIQENAGGRFLCIYHTRFFPYKIDSATLTDTALWIECHGHPPIEFNKIDTKNLDIDWSGIALAMLQVHHGSIVVGQIANLKKTSA